MTIRRSLYEAASFFRHLQSYYRLHVRNVARQHLPNLPGNAILIDKKTYIVPPLSSSVTHAVWIHSSIFEAGYREDCIFRKLRAGRSQFLDLGAAEGYYSAFFAATADRPSRIVAIDLSPAMCKLHEEVKEANKSLSGQPINWSIHRVAITDSESETTLANMGENFVCWYDTDPTQPVKTAKLSRFLEQVEFTPDLVKIDIESYEYEVITSSIDWFILHRPNLHLELHSQMMRDRGKSPEQVMQLLLDHYRIIDSVPSNYQSAPISRIGLVPR